ncbi:MAG: hypothetical protein PUB21_06780 [Bacteroidales bacterium]|nr:hypothetical protein [Bacteroidales bacterium]
MAVSKIRKISSLTLWVMMLISLAVFGLFYFGGVVPGTETAETPVPEYTDLLLRWGYVILGITLVMTIAFAIVHLIKLFKDNFRSAIGNLIAIVLFFALFFIGYSMGSGTPLSIPGYDGADNTPFWLKITDMWLYTAYILLILIFAALVWGSIKKMVDK